MLHYEKPSVKAIGSFREITKVGFTGSSDGCTIVGPGVVGNGNNYSSNCVGSFRS